MKPRSRRIALVMVALLATGLLAGVAGCSAGAKRGLVGNWVADANANKPGKLFDLTIAADGTFFYSGKNALGGGVRFGGKYALGSSGSGPWIKLVYNDFPDRPITWFYKLSGNKLAVSTAPGDLKSGTAMVLTRQ